MAEPTVESLQLWRQCVDPEFGPAAPVAGFEILIAAEEPTGSNSLLYHTIRCRWENDEWVDQEDQIIRLAQPHRSDAPQEELASAWEEFCESVRRLNIEQALEARLATLPPDRSPRGRLSMLARAANLAPCQLDAPVARLP